MLNRIVQASLRHRGVVLALAVIALVYGTMTAWRTRLDVFPDFAPPQVVIQTESPGLAAAQVEALVTHPLETALNGAPGLVAIRSQSIQGLSVITVVFAEGADIYRVRQVVAERLAEAADKLPAGASAPRMGPLTSATSLALAFGLTSQNPAQMRLRSFADATLRPRLLSVPGVARVEVFGGDVRQLQIEVNPDRLMALGVTMNEVLAAAREATAVRGAGFIDSPNQRLVMRTEGQALTPEELGKTTVLHRNGQSVCLRDIARISAGAEAKFGDAQVMGQPGVILLVHSQYGANTLAVTADVEAALKELQPVFQAGQIRLHPRLFRPATFIKTALGNVRQSLLLGGALVLVVLLVFLLEWRTALISFISIPLSLLAAVMVLNAFEVALNTITLGGFAIAIGVVVDDAIIDVENILRRMRQNQALAQPRPWFAVVVDASLEVRSAIVYATFIVALVFVPVLTMTGVSGKLFAPLGWAFILATFASLGVALTVTPALCYTLLPKLPDRAEPGHVRWLKRRHQEWLLQCARHPRLVVAGMLAILLGALATLPFFGGEFLPEFRENHLVVHMGMIPGTSLEESLRLGREVTRALLQHPQVRTVSQQAGRAEAGEDPWGTHLSEFHVDLKPAAGEVGEQVAGEIRQILQQFPGATFRILPFLSERIEETISGATAQVVVNIFGHDLQKLDEAAEAVRSVIAAVSGAADVQIETQPGSPELIIRLRPERLTQFGFRSVAVLEAIQTAFQGSDVGQVYDGTQVYDVTVLLERERRQTPADVGALMVQNEQGLRLPLRELADIEVRNGRHAITHEGAQRRQQVTCNVMGRDLESFNADLREQVRRKVSFPEGTYPVFTGSAAEQGSMRRQLLFHSALVGAGIVLLLGFLFSGRNVLLVLANIPFALVGGVLAVFAVGGLLSVGSLVGFVTLFGITMRNSMMLISHYDHLTTREGYAWNLETAVRGASERLLPIVLTALVTGLGLLPLALGAEEAGHEIESPMALVILGGLMTSTVLNLLVLPVLAMRFGRFSGTPAQSPAVASLRWPVAVCACGATSDCASSPQRDPG